MERRKGKRTTRTPRSNTVPEDISGPRKRSNRQKTPRVLQLHFSSSPTEESTEEEVSYSQTGRQKPRRRRRTKKSETDLEGYQDLDLQGRIDALIETSEALQKPLRRTKLRHGEKWSEEEDKKLSELVTRHGPKNWKRIASLLDSTRTDVQCLHRWNKVLQPGLQKGPWTKAEDNMLRELVAESGGPSRTRWSEISTELPGRIGKQCRERWFNHLDPSVRKGEWSDEEMYTLAEAQSQIGNRWSEIAKLLEGRTENMVKNRWYSSSMRKWFAKNADRIGKSSGQEEEEEEEEVEIKEEEEEKQHQFIPFFSSPIAISSDDHEGNYTEEEEEEEKEEEESVFVDEGMDSDSEYMSILTSSKVGLPNHLRPPSINTSTPSPRESVFLSPTLPSSDIPSTLTSPDFDITLEDFGIFEPEEEEQEEQEEKDVSPSFEDVVDRMKSMEVFQDISPRFLALISPRTSSLFKQPLSPSSPSKQTSLPSMANPPPSPLHKQWK